MRKKSQASSLKRTKVTVTGVRRIKIAEPVPVYDLSVPGTENFALDSGIFVHNCRKSRLPWQELLPIRGKLPNPARTDFAKFMANEEIQAIFRSIGSLPGDPYDSKARRVARVSILTDADPDGKHICSLILMMFAMYLRPWLDGGHVFYVESPLFVGSYKDLKSYGFSRDEMLEKFDPKVRDKVLVSRLKGHGEASADEIHQYAMNPASRRITQFSFQDHDLDMSHRIMGDDVEYRKQILGIKEVK